MSIRAFDQPHNRLDVTLPSQVRSAAREEVIYTSYKELRRRLTQVTPRELGEMFVRTFKPRLAQLEARYQAELAAGKPWVS